MDIIKYQVPIEKLRKNCNHEEDLEFCGTSMDVPALEGVIGQERAVRSMRFGLSMDAFGYNIFVVGPQGTGKSTYTNSVVAKKAAERREPLDWCYINNFSEWDKPLAISLPAGEGKAFQRDMEKMIADLKATIPKACEDGEFEHSRDAVIQSVRDRMGAFYKDVEQEAANSGFSIKQVAPGRFLFIPLRDDKPIPAEEFEKLPEAERAEIDEKRIRLARKLDEITRDIQQIEKTAGEQLAELERQTAMTVAEPLVGQLKDKYDGTPRMADYMEKILKDIVDNHMFFRSAAPAPPPQQPVPPEEAGSADEENVEEEAETIDTITLNPQENADPSLRYKVNLFVNNEKCVGAPVVIEPNPSYYNMFGKIEYKSQLMSMSTDFTMIKPGAIHKANGGYLILQAGDVLMDPFTWDALKKALKYRRAVVENIGEQYRFVPTASLKPEPIHLDVKVILIGSPIYYYIFSMDEDFRKLFKVKVDFDMEMHRDKENIHQYAAFVSSLCRHENLKHFDRGALAKVVEFGSRIAGDQTKLSTHFNEISEIVNEASALADADNVEYVEAFHVDKAIEERKYRANMLEEKLQNMIRQNKILIDTEGSVVGQLNGLFVLEAIGYTFGLPARITARTYMGRGGVINIERETEMSGSIHSKGVMTLSGYLGGKLAQERPMGLTAQVTFEQLYEGVEGDSASSAELYAILSSLSGVPLKQNLAVTGSLDQLGAIQPIGGATEKIEGFFDICRAKGLTGEQGVMIPARNIDNLMLKDEVLDAVKNGAFHIYAVSTVEEGIELMTGVPAGRIGKNGEYTEGSIFYLADKKLKAYDKVLAAAHRE